MTLEEKKKKYAALAHAMQSGVAYKMERVPSETSPKHLRVGINSAMVSHAVLVEMLLAKGVITEDEYFDALVEAMEREVESYQQELSELYGGAEIALA